MEYCVYKKVNFKMKGKLYKMIVKPALTYKSETWAFKVTGKEIGCSRNENVEIHVNG